MSEEDRQFWRSRVERIEMTIAFAAFNITFAILVHGCLS